MKISKMFLIIFIIIVIIIPFTYVYALNLESNENAEVKSFFQARNQEVSKSQKIELVINTNEIKYDVSIFKLKSSESLSNIETEEDVNAQKQEDEIIIELNKESELPNEIILSYNIPEDKNIGDTIKFEGTVTNKDNEEETESSEVEIKIVEESNIEKEDNNDNKGNDNKNSQNMNDFQKENQNQPTRGEQEIGNNIEKGSTNLTNQINMQGTKSQVSGTTDTQNVVEYNGSSNNYLENLEVEGYELNKTFSKDNNTYFINVNSDVNSLNVTATPEESTNTVEVYGNETLSDSTNKILISVTAENGSVRYYRIYVTKNI